MKPMELSPVFFHRSFLRFQHIHRDRCDFELDSFRNPESMAFLWEDYKEGVARHAKLLLDAARWSKADIGSGEILGRVIGAIELRGNNLVQWQPRQGPGTEAHTRLLAARSDRSVREKLERILFSLYHRQQMTAEQFEALSEFCGRRYELLAYLFFIADRHRFLPIRTTSFNKVLEELGTPLRTRGPCSWDNYQQFLAIMRGVQTRLRAEGIADPTLLDAHSFCWILARIYPGRERFPLRDDLEAVPLPDLSRDLASVRPP